MISASLFVPPDDVERNYCPNYVAARHTYIFFCMD